MDYVILVLHLSDGREVEQILHIEDAIACKNAIDNKDVTRVEFRTGANAGLCIAVGDIERVELITGRTKTESKEDSYENDKR